MDRRTLLRLMGASGAALSLPGLAFGMAATDRRLIVILQRGAQDGLSALVPYTDAHYRRYRPHTAIAPPGEADGALDLDGRFGLHPALKETRKMWQAGDLAAIPAIATRYRERSHFDGQNVLENGTGQPMGARDGFLNRALQGFGDPDARRGMAFGPSVPLVLRGGAEVTNWTPSVFREVDEDFLTRLLDSYGEDALLAEALEKGMSPLVTDLELTGREKWRAATGRSFKAAAVAASAAMAAPDGPRIALIDMSGWDTHKSAPTRHMSLFADLDETMGLLRDGLEGVWEDTLILTLSEFGRTARENGAMGTDHGTGGVSFLAGGTVRGGQLHGDWPGLAEDKLYQGRDLYPANALEAVLKTVLVQHMGLSNRYVDRTVLPGTDDIAAMKGLIG